MVKRIGFKASKSPSSNVTHQRTSKMTSITKYGQKKFKPI